MASRLDSPAPDVDRYEQWGDAVGKVNPSNGQDGRARGSRKPRQIPVSYTMTLAPSVRKHAEVIGPQAAKKSLSPEPYPPVPQTDTGGQGEIS